MANGWSITTESVKNSAERVRDLVAQYETEYEKLYAEVFRCMNVNQVILLKRMSICVCIQSLDMVI